MKARIVSDNGFDAAVMGFAGDMTSASGVVGGFSAYTPAMRSSTVQAPCNFPWASTTAYTSDPSPLIWVTASANVIPTASVGAGLVITSFTCNRDRRASS